MNRGVVQNSPVQQMNGGNPNWWAIAAPLPPSRHHHHPNSPFTLPTQHHHHHHNNFNFVPPHSSPFPFSPPSEYNLPLSCSINDNQDDHITPDSWSHQLPVSGLVGEEERSAAMEQLVKQENYNPSNSQGIVYQNNEDFQDPPKSNNHNNNSFWSPHGNTKFTASTNSTTTTAAASSSPQSCVTNNLFEFSSTNAKSDHQLKSECNSSAVKKAKVQTSATQSTLKVRKFGDRITILHQIVSPFGKTDTASVLLEAIGYIRFLHSQIEALSHPYLSSGSGNNKKEQQHPHSAQGERKAKFPEDSGQLLNGNCLKRKGGPDEEEPKDLRSRGLCLVPVSSTLNVGRDKGADYWSATLGDFQ